MSNIYGVSIIQDGQDHLVTVRDLPEVCTAGSNYAEACELAADAIDAVVCHRIKTGKSLPLPSQIETGEIAITLPLETGTKAELYRAWKSSGISKAELGRRLNIHETEVRRILDPRHGTRLEAIERAFKALGYRLAVSSQVV